MIAVGGFNTSIDKSMETDSVRIGGVARVRNVRTLPGGKGLHVALTVAALGERVCLVGIIDDAHHHLFAEFLAARGVDFEGVPVSGPVRTCLAVRDAEGRMTELLEPGPEVDDRVGEELKARFRTVARTAAVATLSGSLPSGLRQTSYGELISELAGVRCLLDASGQALEAGLAAHPFLVKPNRDEASELTGLPVMDEVSARRAASALVARGASCAIVSLGEAGAVARFQDQILIAHPPQIAARNSVGSGDCLLGGVAVALARGWDAADALRLGVACGAANALNAETGVLRLSDVDRLAPQVRIDTCQEPLDQQEGQ